MSDDGYDWADNARGCYALAIRAIRLDGVRVGRYPPRPDDDEEMRVSGKTSVKEDSQ